MNAPMTTLADNLTLTSPPEAPANRVGTAIVKPIEVISAALNALIVTLLFATEGLFRLRRLGLPLDGPAAATAAEPNGAWRERLREELMAECKAWVEDRLQRARER